MLRMPKSLADESCYANNTQWQQRNFCQNHGQLMDKARMTKEQRVPFKEGLFLYFLTKKAVLNLSYNNFEKLLSRKEDLQQFPSLVKHHSFAFLLLRLPLGHYIKETSAKANGTGAERH